MWLIIIKFRFVSIFLKFAYNMMFICVVLYQNEIPDIINLIKRYKYMLSYFILL